MSETITQHVCLTCHTDVTAIDYHSPMWQGGALLPAVVRVSCACGETFEYIETMWRGERLHTHPPNNMSSDRIVAAIAEMNARQMSLWR